MSATKESLYQEQKFREKELEASEPQDALRSTQIGDYRFLENKREHLHQRLINGEWKNLTGVSSVVKNITDFGVAAYYGARRTLMDFSYDPKLEKDNVQGFKQVMSHLLEFTDEEIASALYDAYKAHATYSKERAALGTDRHEEVDLWVKKCIKENGGKPMESDSPVIKKFLKLTEKFMPYTFKASEKHGWNDELWIGGIADVLVETPIGMGIWDNKNRPVIYGKDLLQMGGYTHLFNEKFTHVLGIPLEGDEARVFYDVPQLKKAFENQLQVFRFMQSVEPTK